MTYHYPIPSYSIEHESKERKNTFLASPPQSLSVLCREGFMRLVLDCHLVLLIWSLSQKLLNYPLNPLPQDLLGSISICNALVLLVTDEQLLTLLSVSAIIPLISLISPLHPLCLGCSRLSKWVLPHTETVFYFSSLPSAFSESLNMYFIRMRAHYGQDGGMGVINKLIPTAWMICFFPETTAQNLLCPFKVLTTYFY